MAISLLAAPVSAELSVADRDALYVHLDKLRTGWDQLAVDGANAIFNKSIYGTPDWVAFFGGYFSTRAMTQSLKDYLYYPMFGWLDDIVHEKLQNGLASVGLPYVRSVVNSHPTDLGSWLASSPPDLGALVAWLRLIAELSLYSCPSGELPRAACAPGAPGFDRRSVYTWARDLILEDSRFVATAVINPAEQPYVNYVRMQLQTTLADSQPRTPEVLAEIAVALGLSGDRLDMWQRHSLLVHDNQFLNTADWAFLRTLWDSIPVGLPKPRNVSVNDAIGNSGSQYQWPLSYSNVNICCHVPWGGENGFPEEVAPIYASVFGLIAVHELNHVVDHVTYSDRPVFDPVLDSRRRALVADAGPDRYNYLRSIFPDGTFTGAPQEFFASISNMYFANTAATFRVGELRLQAGRHQPIEQFLFFLDVYSQGSDRSRGYTLDSSANLNWYDISLSRDAQGRIVGFTLPDRAYGVTYSASGHVASIPPPAPGFYTVTPCRVADTRETAGPWGGPALVAGTPRTFAIGGRCGISTSAKSVAFNFAVIQPTAVGHLTVYPGVSNPPIASAMNFRAGQVRANNAIVAVGPGGLTVVSGQPSGTTHLIIDVTGYFE